MAVKKPAKAPAKKTTAIQDRYTKTAILSTISENTGLTKKEVSNVLDELGDLIERHIKKRGVGEFTLPGLLKIKAVKRPARPARKMFLTRLNLVNSWISLKNQLPPELKCYL